MQNACKAAAGRLVLPRLRRRWTRARVLNHALVCPKPCTATQRPYIVNVHCTAGPSERMRLRQKEPPVSAALHSKPVALHARVALRASHAHRTTGNGTAPQMQHRSPQGRRACRQGSTWRCSRSRRRTAPASLPAAGLPLPLCAVGAATTFSSSCRAASYTCSMLCTPSVLHSSPQCCVSGNKSSSAKGPAGASRPACSTTHWWGGAIYWVHVGCKVDLSSTGGPNNATASVS